MMAADESRSEIIRRDTSELVAAGIRSLAASFPFFASLGQLWSEYETHRTSKRIEELFDNLRKELDSMDEEVALLGNVLSDLPDFPELLEITIDKVRKEYGASKRATYARMLARLIVAGSEYEFDQKVALLESLDSLVEVDLRVLLLFQGKDESQISGIAWRELGLDGDASHQLWELSCHLVKLESRGLILCVSQHTGVTYVRDKLTKEAARHQETTYRVLPAGERLIDALA